MLGSEEGQCQPIPATCLSALKIRLMDRYAAAINEFSRCAGILNERMGTMYKGDYERSQK